MKTTLCFDARASVREYDENGFLHVSVSHLSKAQVRPYYGREVPGWQRLGLDPERVYNAYCPPEELGRPETVKSTNGIPIQLEHHEDFPDAPALLTRVGQTGTDGAFRDPYLDNSLHFTVKKAIDRIEDGSMRELSLCYRYTPDFTPGTTPEGETYDFVMRDISANHVALVELGRAGRDVLVGDASLKGTPMNEELKTTAPGDNDPAVEEKEVALAETIKAAAEAITEMHEEGPQGLEDKTAEGEPATEPAAAPEAEKAEDGDALAQAVEALKAKGIEEAEAQALVKAIAEALATAQDEAEAEAAADEEPEAGEKAEDEAPEEEAPKAEDECAEPGTAADSAIKAAEDRILARFDAVDECRPVLGKVRPSAFDSAGAVYLAALEKLGVPVKDMNPAAARDAYRAYILGASKAVKRGTASDAAPKAKLSPLAEKLMRIKEGA